MAEDIRVARRKMQTMQDRAAQVAEEQQKALGYRRDPGYDPSPRPSRPYVAERDRIPAEVPAAGLSAGVTSSAEQEQKRRKQAAQGRVFTNADL